MTNSKLNFIVLSVLAFILMTCFAHARESSPRALLQSGDFEGARTSLSRITKNDPNRELHRMFLDGLILVRQGRLPDAISQFRRILDLAPDYEPARRELAATLMVTGQVTSARFHAETLIAQTSDDRLRAQTQALIDASSGEKPFGYALRFGIAPSSNTNKGASSSIVYIGGLPFTLNAASRATKGTAITLGATVWRNWALRNNWQATLSASLDSKIYSTGKNNELVFGSKAMFSHRSKAKAFSFGPTAEVSFLDGKQYRRRFGIQGRYQVQLKRKLRFDSYLSIQHQNYPTQAHRDGLFVDGRLGLAHAINSSTKISFAVPFEYETTHRPHLNHTKFGVTFGIEKMWRGGLYSALTLSHSVDNFHGFFPGTSVVRKDKVAKIGVAFRHSKITIGKYAPEISYSYTKSRSNVGFYNFESHDFGLGMSMAF